MAPSESCACGDAQVTRLSSLNRGYIHSAERAKAMISLAHPDFRDGLEREARTNGLIPRSFV
jgi:hypothetical protein